MPTARKRCLHVRRFESHYYHLTFIRIISDKVYIVESDRKNDFTRNRNVDGILEN